MADQVLIATETGGYGVVPSTGYRKIKPTGDPATTRIKRYEHRGIGDGGVADADEVRTVEDGGEGPLELPFQSNGMGILLRAGASTSSNFVVDDEDAVTAKVQTFAFAGTDAPANTSLCTEVSRSRRSGTADVSRYSGGRPKQYDFTQDKDGFLVVKIDMDYLKSELVDPDPGRTPTVPDIAIRYLMRDAKITTKIVGDEGAGTARCFETFKLSVPIPNDFDDTCLNRDVRRHEPSRTGAALLPTGEAMWTYENPLFTEAFLSGEKLEVVASWLGPVIEAGIRNELTISLGAISFTGSDAQVSLDAKTKQTLPFECRSLNGAAPLIIENVSNDVGY